MGSVFNWKANFSGRAVVRWKCSSVALATQQEGHGSLFQQCFDVPCQFFTLSPLRNLLLSSLSQTLNLVCVRPSSISCVTLVIRLGVENGHVQLQKVFAGEEAASLHFTCWQPHRLQNAYPWPSTVLLEGQGRMPEPISGFTPKQTGLGWKFITAKASQLQNMCCKTEHACDHSPTEVARWKQETLQALNDTNYTTHVGTYILYDHIHTQVPQTILYMCSKWCMCISPVQAPPPGTACAVPQEGMPAACTWGSSGCLLHVPYGNNNALSPHPLLLVNTGELIPRDATQSSTGYCSTPYCYFRFMLLQFSCICNFLPITYEHKLKTKKWLQVNKIYV